MPKRDATSKVRAGFDIKLLLPEGGRGWSVANYRRKQVVFAQGEAADAVFYIQKGTIKLTVLSREGKEAIIGILGDGDFFGEGCLGNQPLRMATAAAMVPCSTIRLEKTLVMSLLYSEPAFSQMMLDHLLSRNIRIEEDLVDQISNSSEKRLARALLLMANFGEEGKSETALPKVTQATLAEMVGTTRSRISFFMNKFREQGFIEYDDALIVRSSLLSVLLHD